MDMQIWMREPARHWEEALPLGNGRLGAMVYGGGCNMHRTPYSGRNFEYYSEDSNLSYLAGRDQGKAMTEKGLLGSFKHFLGKVEQGLHLWCLQIIFVNEELWSLQQVACNRATFFSTQCERLSKILRFTDKQHRSLGRDSARDLFRFSYASF